MTTTRPEIVHTGQATPRRPPPPKKKPVTTARVVLRVFLTVMAVGWLFPIAWAVYASLRDYNYTSTHGYFSFGGFTLENYVHAWARGNFAQTFTNTAIIVIPSVLITLLLASSRGVRAGPVHLPVQPHAAGAVHRGEPAAAAGVAGAAVPAVPQHRGAVLVQRLRHALRHLLSR